jgi:hypothetical protein
MEVKNKGVGREGAALEILRAQEYKTKLRAPLHIILRPFLYHHHDEDH